MQKMKGEFVRKLATGVPHEPGVWQPIKTVPKDGTVILLHHSMNVLCGYGLSTRPKKAIAVGYFDVIWHVGRPGGHSEGGSDNQFTHWMPLPNRQRGNAASELRSHSPFRFYLTAPVLRAFPA